MRELFPGHYRPDEEQTKQLWSKASFVFDTNVLLEPYVLPEQAREELLSVLDTLTERTWIPYQVAMEFHRRRFSKMRDASRDLAELRKTAESSPRALCADIKRLDFDKWNTGITDLPQILQQLTEAYERLDKALQAAESKLPSISLRDPIAERLAKLLSGRVGVPPATQKALDALVGDGGLRYDAKIPPGFSDHKKGDTFNDRGLIYESKFGDLILWRQLIEHVKAQQLRHVIFVTADAKEDWWYSEKSGERLGPHPALVEEFLRETAAEGFWIYTPDSFLEHARKQLAVAVADQTVEQVKQSAIETLVQQHAETSAASQSWLTRQMLDETGPDPATAHQLKLLRKWAQLRHPEASLTSGLNIDIAVEQNGQLTDAYHVIRTHHLATLGPRLAALATFPGIRHHAIAFLERNAVPKLIFGVRESYYAELRDMMRYRGICSIIFANIDHGELGIIDELDTPSN